MSETRTTSGTGGQKGTKLERFDLIPTGPLAELAEHFGVGASKYADHQWRKGYEWSKSYAALSRHLTAFWAGFDYDVCSNDPNGCSHVDVDGKPFTAVRPDACFNHTGSHHMAAVAWHAFALLEFKDQHPAHDDRHRAPVDEYAMTEKILREQEETVGPWGRAVTYPPLPEPLDDEDVQHGMVFMAPTGHEEPPSTYEGLVRYWTEQLAERQRVDDTDACDDCDDWLLEEAQDELQAAVAGMIEHGPDAELPKGDLSQWTDLGFTTDEGFAIRQNPAYDDRYLVEGVPRLVDLIDETHERMLIDRGLLGEAFLKVAPGPAGSVIQWSNAAPFTQADLAPYVERLREAVADMGEITQGPHDFPRVTLSRFVASPHGIEDRDDSMSVTFSDDFDTEQVTSGVRNALNAYHNRG